MTISPTTHVRQKVLTAIKANSAVTDKIPAARLYPSKTPNAPVKPFGRYGVSTSSPDRYSCWRGGDVAAAYHIFVGVTDSIPDAEAFAADCADAIADAIDAIDDCYVVRTQVLADPEEADVSHAIVFFEMKALEEV